MSFEKKRGKQAAGSLQTCPEMDDLNQASEISHCFVGEQAVTGRSVRKIGGSGISRQETFLMYI